LVGESVSIKSRKSSFSETSSQNNNNTKKQLQPKKSEGGLENIVNYIR